MLSVTKLLLGPAQQETRPIQEGSEPAKTALLHSTTDKNVPANHTKKGTATNSQSSATTSECATVSISPSINLTEVQGPFTPQLLHDVWARQPLLIRNAFPVPGDVSFVSTRWPTKQDLIELASNDDAESRLITHIPGDDFSYELELGPFDHDYVINLLDNESEAANNEDNNYDEIKYTLVVNDMDRFLPKLADWMYTTFGSAVQAWRRDDAQLSYSNQGGGIGRHCDDYDVVLVQTSGTKQWKVGRQLVSQQEEDRRLIAGLDVRVLESIDDGEESDRQEYSVIVGPGDALYLPPRVSHEGAALTNDCATLSVGFRAPSASDLISQLAETISMQTTGASLKRYTDPNEVLMKISSKNCYASGGDGEDENKKDNTQRAMVDNELTQNTKKKVKQLLFDAIDELIDEDEKWDEWLGTFVTESKRYRFEYPLPLQDDDVAAKDHVEAFLKGSGTLCQSEGIAFAYSKSRTHPQSNSIHRLFVNGVCWNVSPKVPVHVIANERRLALRNMLAAAGSGDDGENSIVNGDNIMHEETRDLLEDLVAKGYLYYVHTEGDLQ